MKVIFLGTGTSQGVPVIGCTCEVCRSVDFHDKRLRSSILIQTKDLNFIIDTGPDFRQQMLRERVSKLDAVLFTHAHKDHTAGLDDIRSFNFLQEKDMPIYGEPAVLDQLKQEFSYIFAEKKYPGVPKVDINSIANAPFDLLGEQIVPIRVLHYKLPVLGFRIRDFTYITDAKQISEEEKEKVKGSKIVVLNALQIKEHMSHFTLEEALELMEELKPEQGYLTHISHKLGLHAEVSKNLPKNIHLAWDSLQLET
ncbi:MAG: MBL fold metallo-hydrolase [Bacteroidota bacterium]